MLYYLTKIVHFTILILTLFNSILGNIVEGDVYISTLPDHLLNQQPPILEITTYAETGKWNQLGVTLELNSVGLDGCHDCIRMYQLWIQEKANKEEFNICFKSY